MEKKLIQFKKKDMFLREQEEENTQSENQIDSQIENTNSLKFRKLLFELIMSSFVFFIFVYIFTVYKYKVK